MNKRKFIKLNIGILTATLLLLGGISSVVVAKNKPIYEKHVFRTPVCGVTNFHTSYSGKTHKITFSGTASGFRDLVIKYDGKIVKELKLKKADKHFKATIPFKGYKSFKICDDNGHVLKKVSAAQYATKRPRINSYYQTNEHLKIELSGKKGDIVTIWKNGKAVKRKRITDKFGTTITVPNALFEDNSKITVTRHTIGKKTSKGVELNRSKDNSISIDK
ncbi:MAG: hypothetical protein ACRCZW_11220 [Lactobacillaceae bacterium]|uniref:hypothetical protein n=1 Tax=Lactobacillus sp. B4007 TaxID=2818032 RepID=UPI002269B69F|nr:hypothetical protein [Lactobacillus sp. B4007]MCX8725027.1 hypothetical protein [Lactobacillus sp. B4007]